MIYKILFWIWFIFILLVSVLPTIPETKVDIGITIFRIDYLEHLVAYFFLGFFFIMWHKGNPAINIKTLIIYLLAGIAYASLTECIQLFIRGRTFNPVDLIYNCIGIVLGLYITFLLCKRHLKVKRIKT
jgi:VanZ family protein